MVGFCKHFWLLLVCLVLAKAQSSAQESSLSGIAEVLTLTIFDENGNALPFATVGISGTSIGTTTDLDGTASLDLPNGYPVSISISSIGYTKLDTTLTTSPTPSVSSSGAKIHVLRKRLKPADYALDDVVVTGTLSPTQRTESPVPVEVYTRTFLLSDPTPSLFDAMQNVNGVRPQLNCNVCNTGDIHINGLEGPYTMVTIDGMPIVSGLATVYGLMGIPNAMIERVEVVKGPAGSLYGSEAVGGLINVITRNVARAPRFSADAFSTAWGDLTLDLGYSSKLGKHAQVLTSANAYYYDNPIDNNGDNFTDLTLAKRLSIFQKWSFDGGRLDGLSFAGRGLVESRWGGEMDFDPETHRGTDLKYGEAIDTRRVEILGRYDAPSIKGLAFSGSANYHQQRSDYGTMSYDGDQAIVFGQAMFSRKVNNHGLLFGAATRYTYYDDNSFATEAINGENQPDEVLLPGLFVQDEWVRGRHRILAGLRYDYDARHGNIWTPRLAVKLPAGEGANLRINLGTGFRVVNLFTEEHAALSGAREVIIAEELQPERSRSINLNYTKNWATKSDMAWAFEGSTWYTHFSNQIIPDYTTNANQIRYDNLSGFSVSKGLGAELRASSNRWRAMLGATFVDVSIMEENERSRPLLSERWSGVWSTSFTLPSQQWSFDYTGSLYGPMLLPVQGPLDERAAESPWFSLQNLQATFSPGARAERSRSGKTWKLYGGVKNLLNFTPAANSIARSFDPFDKQVSFDNDGNAIATADNPQALVFDPSYVYASNVGRRIYVGVRYTIKK